MKILIVSPTLNHGGAERVATLWAEGFRKKGHEVFFVANIEKEAAYNISVDVLPLTPRSGHKLIRYIKSISILRSYYKEYQPDVIIGVMFACSLLAKLAEFGLKIPVVNTEHSSFEQPKEVPLSIIDRLAKFYLNYFYDAITVLTKVDYRLIENRFKHVFVLPNPTFLKPLEDLPQKDNIVLAAGRLDGWHVKGFDVLIKAWGNLMKNEECRMKNIDWRLQIAGTGSEESLEFLKNLCKENGVEDSVDFLGFVSDMESLYKKASVFVLSSRYEGFGMVLIEAMSQGCAPIACDYKGRQREILEELNGVRFEDLKHGSMDVCGNGVLCPPDDVETLAAAIQKMVSDEQYRRQSQKGAVLRTHSFTNEMITDKWESFLSQI